MTNAELKARRQRLHQIYVEHDISGFREFLRLIATERPELAGFVDKTDDELSHLMYSAKAQLLYLGDDWQAARNRLRLKQFWSDRNAAMAPLPVCATCQYFREAPEGDTDPCVQLGATPADIICPAFKSSSPI